MSVARAKKNNPLPGSNARTRAADGFIVSFLNERGEDLTLVRKDVPPRAGLIDACAVALAFDPTFRVTAYSTPQTIYDDMSGARMDYDGTGGKRFTPQRPEIAALAAVSLGHLAHPMLGVGRLDGDSRRNSRERTGVAKSKGGA